MVNTITEAGRRLERYQAQLPGVLEGWRFAPVVRALMGMRGLALLNAMTLAVDRAVSLVPSRSPTAHPGPLASRCGSGEGEALAASAGDGGEGGDGAFDASGHDRAGGTPLRWI